MTSSTNSLTHTIAQFQGDSKPYLPIILAGQSILIDKLSYRSSQPLASRIVARNHHGGRSVSYWFSKDGMR